MQAWFPTRHQTITAQFALTFLAKDDGSTRVIAERILSATMEAGTDWLNADLRLVEP